MKSQNIKKSESEGGAMLYKLGQGQNPEPSNRCGLQLLKNDNCATTDMPQGSAAGTLGSDGDDEDAGTGKEPTNVEDDGEDDGDDDHGRRRVPDVSAKKETWIEKNKKVKAGADGWRQTQPTAYAVRDATHVWKLSRDSEHAPAYEALTERQERIDFLKRHGVVKRH